MKKETLAEKKRRILHKMASKEADRILRQAKEKIMQDAKQLIRQNGV